MKKATALFFTFGLMILSAQAQADLEKELRSTKWYSDGSPKYTVISYYKTPLKGKAGSMVFLKSGKLFRCDSTGNSTFTAEGKEVLSQGTFGCDSLATYVLKNNMIHIIEENSRHWYYKIFKRTGSLEFSPIYSEEFEKK